MFAVLNYFVLGHMLEVVFNLCVLFGSVYCYAVFTFALSVLNKIISISVDNCVYGGDSPRL